MFNKFGVTEDLPTILQAGFVLLRLIASLHKQDTLFKPPCSAISGQLTATFLKIAFSLGGSF